jgi:hypothetical protein
MTTRLAPRLVAGAFVLALVPLVTSAPPAIHAALTRRPPPHQQAPQPPAATDDRLVVHEWGTFTTIAGEDGSAVKWRPLDEATDLPRFVYANRGRPVGAGLRHNQQCVKCDMEAIVRMETPVIYFYTDRETVVSARVDFPSGQITEWYPQARAAHSSIDWGRLTVVPDAKVEFLTERRDSHYYPARETDAAPVRVCGNKRSGKGDEHEKFLFYRGVGSFDLPLAVKLDGDRVTVSNNGPDAIPRIIIFDNVDGKVAYGVHDLTAGATTVERPSRSRQSDSPGSLDSLYAELEALLVANGLYEKEAKAMIKTWRDSWFEEGLRVFYVLPRSTPEMQESMLNQITRLGDPRAEVRESARQAIRSRGRFAEPVIKRILEKTADAALRARIEEMNLTR